MSPWWQSLWDWAGSGIIVALAWILRELWSIKKQRDQDAFKLRLDLHKLEHDVRFKKVFDKVSDNIVELFPRLTKLNRDMKALFQDLESAGTPSKEEQGKMASESYNNAYNSLHDHRLLIPLPIFTEVNDYLDAAKAARISFNSGVRKEQAGKLKENYEDYWETAQNELAKLKPKYERIHKAMQQFLGLERSYV
jgi:hypothetical protein